MASGTATHIDASELERAIKAVEPSAFLVPSRILRRVIRADRRLAGIGLAVPHHKSYLIGREALRPLVEKKELGVKPDSNFPATAILLARPEAETLAALTREEILARYWRMLFHAHVHVALEGRLAERKLTAAGIRQRIHQIGQTEFNEIRTVLRQEHYLLPPRDDRRVYVEFAAVYLELRYFAPSLLARYFPALQSYEGIDALLAEDVDAARLFIGTRLPGARNPVAQTIPEVKPIAEEESEGPPPVETVSARAYQRLTERAARAAARGNLVRAALSTARAAAVAPLELAGVARTEAVAYLDNLAGRLKMALQLDETAADQWRLALAPLLPRAARGIWPTEARFLYDLQKVCVDREREIYTVDLVEWAASFGRRPVKRPLEHEPDVLALKHLRSAARRLGSARLPDDSRALLGGLLASAIHQVEHQLREKLHPLIEETFQEVGLSPRNFPEQNALNRLTEELLDKVVENGHLNMGQLRDAISRNNLKLPDLSGPGELVCGDRLLQANRRLAVRLDGIYHRGEVYLRGFQRLSALAFGTRVGRFLTRYLAVPFGGGYVLLEGLHYLLEETISIDVDFTTLVTVPIMGVFLFALLYLQAFQDLVGRALKLAYRGGRTLLVELPTFLYELPLVSGVLRSRALRYLYHYLLKPLVFALLVWQFLRRWEVSSQTALLAGLAVFLFSNLILNSRIARDLEEAFTDWLVLTWRRIRFDVLPGLFRMIVDFFKWLVEGVDRVLYTVDEWLRFRGGDSQLSLIVKAGLGLFWSAVTYVVRFAVNLLIEPQVNPIKHFPVVTVSHKLLLPLAFSPKLTHEPSIFGGLLVAWLGFSVAEANSWAFLIIAAIPGIFGFLVWEMKENWRLYRANRPESLRPVPIGHHGETMVRLLRPGFHSGTLPKLYARLRRAERRALRSGSWRSARKQRDALAQVEESIRHFVERTILAALRRSRGWNHLPIHAGEIGLASNRVRIELSCPSLAAPSLAIAFEEQSGWLLAGIAAPGWLDRLAHEQRLVLRTALAGFYKFAGVDLVGEQIESLFEPSDISYDIAEEGLVVWTGPDGRVEAVYDLEAGPRIEPDVRVGRASDDLPALLATSLRFDLMPIRWETWVEVWEQDQEGKGIPGSFLEGVCLLPRTVRVR